jgi:hypothetical protein
MIDGLTEEQNIGYNTWRDVVYILWEWHLNTQQMWPFSVSVYVVQNVGVHSSDPSRWKPFVESTLL